ncbi:MAG: glycosyltransferase family 39 protein [Acidobacteriota bacterium]
MALPECARDGAARRWSAAGGAALCAAIALHAWLVAAPVLRHKGDFEWDPAHHALWGHTIYDDLRRGNVISLAFDTYRQVYWPPVQSWAIAAALFVLGPSQTAVRLVSLAAFYVAALLLGALALRMDPAPRPTAAIVTTGLWLTAARFTARFATEAFTETLAMALTAASFLVFAWALRRRTARAVAIAGASAMLVYLTKTDYGIMAIAAQAAVLTVDAWPRRGFRGPIPFLAPVAAIGLLWFAYVPKLLSTIQALNNRPYGPPRFSTEGLLYHFEIIEHWADGAFALGALLACLALSFFSARTRILQVVLVYLGLALFLHEISQSKDEKHIVKALPWLFLLAGHQAGRLVAAARARGSILGGAAATVLGAALLARLPATWALREADGRYGTEPVREAIVARIASGRSHLVAGEPTELAPYMIAWSLETRPGQSARMEPDLLSHGSHPREWFEARLEPFLARRPWLRFLERGSRPPTVYEVEHLMPKFPDTVSSDPATVLAPIFTLRKPDRIFVIGVDPGSPWDRHEYRRYIHGGAPFALYLSRGSGYALSEHLRFDGAFMDLWVFDRAR